MAASITDNTITVQMTG